ncbi:hypothetical protein RHI9324_05346 [Rhizobium sp. CECT 9324]|nr:hypothetical protein RHI9324_05346 [Rhizobium sp. CECT 9324]
MHIRTGIMAALAALATSSAPAAQDHWPVCTSGKRNTCIVDGDTFWLQGIKHRIVGYDAPEAGDGARCGQERALADRATQQLQHLMSAPGIQYQVQGEDRYGRTLTRVMTPQGDIADQMIGLGLGRAYRGGYRDRRAIAYGSRE